MGSRDYIEGVAGQNLAQGYCVTLGADNKFYYASSTSFCGLGFTKQTAELDTVATVQIMGEISNVDWNLTPARIYYQGDAGTISLVPGEAAYAVGISVATDTLLILQGASSLAGSRVLEWQAGTRYQVDDVFFFDNTLYRVKLQHTSASSFDITSSTARARYQPIILGNSLAIWLPDTFYAKYACITHNSRIYRALASHVSAATFTETIDDDLIWECIFEAPPFPVIIEDTAVQLTTTWSSAKLVEELEKKAALNHIHANYALLDHTHANYALLDHTHANYALLNHTHANYALLNHTHAEYYTNSNHGALAKIGMDEDGLPLWDGQTWYNRGAKVHRQTAQGVVALNVPLEEAEFIQVYAPIPEMIPEDSKMKHMFQLNFHAVNLSSNSACVLQFRYPKWELVDEQKMLSQTSAIFTPRCPEVEIWAKGHLQWQAVTAGVYWSGGKADILQRIIPLVGAVILEPEEEEIAKTIFDVTPWLTPWLEINEVTQYYILSQIELKNTHLVDDLYFELWRQGVQLDNGEVAGAKTTILTPKNDDWQLRVIGSYNVVITLHIIS